MVQAANKTPPSAPDQSSRFLRLTFTQGVLVGQLSLIIVVILFVRYVIFEDPEAARHNRRHKAGFCFPVGMKPRRSSIISSRRNRPSLADRNVKPLVPDVLSKLSYDLSTHPPETADWLNVLVAQAIVAYRSLVHGELDEESASSSRGEKAKRMVEEALNSVRDGEPGFISIDYITVTEVDFGDQFPLCTNARVRPADETGRMRIEVDVDYSDHVTLSIETKVVINFPTSRFAVLPVCLGITLNQLSATVMAEIPPVAIPLPVEHDPAAPTPAILLSLDPDFTLCMSTTSLLGARAKLEDIPKVEQLILGRLRGWIVDNLVWPKVRVLKLPGVGSKGAVENAENGTGEYVWVESEAMPVEKPVKPTSTLTPEADEDISSIPTSLSTSSLDQHTTAVDYTVTHLSDVVPSHPPRSTRYRSNSTSSRPMRPSLQLPNEFTTPPQLNRTGRPDNYPSTFQSNLTSEKTLSDSFPSNQRNPILRHSTSMMVPNPNQIYRAAFANSNHHHHPSGNESISSSNLSSSERWTQGAGGIWGMSLGLSQHGINQGGRDGTYGIRERVKEIERIKALKATTSNSPAPPNHSNHSNHSSHDVFSD
ncbi:uncharacterized protein MELLADRAFT_111891 [Melampsora larici-populina 98AG31]|uniref:Maintenance of mitochondrial morphology protein 1 n=1 Tax=Melampsora larici-populina (strain 98AG31 / pathotype 3-4-7) TaxID=747676 RepID=F4S4Q0_MELLP|nr:uncharacterized protein MELLADRAFT_111891 [Melampsora larici-populina 98AG31]EGG00389.1 hypothetical protein MELLADRAFT_111891 [Melampsora larici-populina 98AG31]